jgi:hypothetical protein
MSLDIHLTANVPTHVFSRNITHNLNKMADAAGLYQAIWHPEELGFTKAKQLIKPLKAGLKLLKSDPEKFRAFDAPNGWGNYVTLVDFVEKYLAACIAWPNATISAHR